MTGLPRHPAIRTCVICGNRASKRELVRVVATLAGEVRLDPTGKEPGRGTYVCDSSACIRTDLKRGRLEQVLRRELSDDDWSQLLSALGGLIPAIPTQRG